MPDKPSQTVRVTLRNEGVMCCVPFEGNETLSVTIALDNTARTVKIRRELARVLRANRTAAKAWKGWSYTRQREHAEANGKAKKPETRARRLANALQALKGLHSRLHGDRR